MLSAVAVAAIALAISISPPTPTRPIGSAPSEPLVAEAATNFMVDVGEKASEKTKVAFENAAVDAHAQNEDAESHEKTEKTEKTETPDEVAEESENSPSRADHAVTDSPQSTEPEKRSAAYTFETLHLIGDSYAHDGGMANEWQPGYYVAHRGTETGAMFSELSVGDKVSIDGMTVTVEGRWNTPWYDDVWLDARNRLGWDKVLFQTCFYDDNSKIHIVYGTPSESRDFHTGVLYALENGASISAEDQQQRQSEYDALMAEYSAWEAASNETWAFYDWLVQNIESGLNMDAYFEEYYAKDAYANALLRDYEEHLAQYESKWAWSF